MEWKGRGCIYPALLLFARKAGSRSRPSVKGRAHVAVYAAAVDEPVVVKVVSGESEAELVCGLLRSAGIECGYRDTDAVDSQFEEFIASGPREIIVHPSDLEAAQALVGEAAS